MISEPQFRNVLKSISSKFKIQNMQIYIITD